MIDAPQPSITVVTVLFNNAAGFRTTGESVRAQTYPAIEWIVIDGGSTDGTVDQIKAWAESIAFWVSEPDRGIYDAMNKGLAHATGDYIVFLNGGDAFPAPDTLEHAAQALTGDACDMLFGGTYLRFADDNAVYRPPRPVASSLWHGLPAVHQATYFRTSLHRAHPYDLSYKVSAEYAAIAAMVVAGARTRVLDRPLSVNSCAGDSFSFRNWRGMMTDCMRLQRSILRLGRHRILLSAAKRLINTVGFAVLGRFPAATAALRRAPRRG